MAKMHIFLRNNRSELVDRCKRKVSERYERAATEDQLRFGVPLFLDQLIQTLELEQTAHPMDSRKISGPSGGGAAHFDMGVGAAQHGRQFADLNFTIDQVVHDYGDLCQSITDLAFERDAPFTVDEFRTLNRCLDNAIAEAVSEFSFQKESSTTAQREAEENERLGTFAHELRNYLSNISLAFSAAKLGSLSLSGATGTVLERNIAALKNLIDQSFTKARGLPVSPIILERFSVAEFVAELRQAAELSAASQQCTFVASDVEPHLAVEADRELLLAAVGNLLQNGFKFTRPGTKVTLNAYALADQILIDVKDQCGGLPTDSIDEMFTPFRQLGGDKTGLGLGLSIARRSIEVNGGQLHARNLAGEGCVFTISLPRFALANKESR